MKLLKRFLSFLLLLVIILSLVGLAAFGLVTLTVLCSPVIAAIVVTLCAAIAWDQSAPDPSDRTDETTEV
jgi:hypothetical protein